MGAVEQFATVVAGPEPALDRAALAMAAGADPELDSERWLVELDRLADGVDSLDALTTRLFRDERFTGNTRHYYDPRNSLLNEVLDRRTGIPITLAVVCIEVGRRAGIELQGVGMPGHFLVRVGQTDRYLDAFDGGRMLDLDGCEELFRTSTGAGPEVEFGPELLGPAPTKAILVRMLQNLRAVYRASMQPIDLEWVMRMRLALPGASTADLTELAQAVASQGRHREGAQILEEYADRRPQYADGLQLSARALRAHLN